ncbi:MAG: helix-turn-helix domain-containing protein [Solirubrobacterales bacterium]|nr:helix-turn-helix domain-containing protein [Solirubrobacterales bacterium]
MDRKSELGEFLKARRAELTPEQAGLGHYGERRRVRGLRREELAQLAGLSVTYYTRLEQGRGGNVSDSVIAALARALALSDDERLHLHNLTGHAHDPRRRNECEHIRPSIRALIGQLGDVPGILVGRRGDVLVWNPAAHRLFAPDLAFDSVEHRSTRPNLCHRVFLSDYAREFYVDWEQKKKDAAAYLRVAAGRYPDDPEMAALVGELSMKSPEFARLWAGHDVRDCGQTTREFHHPDVGFLTLTEEVMPLVDDPGQRLMLISAEPGSASERALRLLAALAVRPGDPDLVPES